MQAGAARIDCEAGTPGTLTYAAFQSHGGEIVVIAINQTDTPQPCTLAWQGRQASSTIPEKSVTTVEITR
ncbi:MAG: hypothetical protein GXX94_07620 [Chloroflexi bacterium]|nr:hypothetical protein [Chloroflexota bacterium]